MSVEVDIQYAASGEGLPEPEEFVRWVEAAVAGRRDNVELTVRVVDEAEITELNRTYRGYDQATNVLSFPVGDIPGVWVPLLGDVVVCAPVVRRQAREQRKTEHAHWAHMVVHGTLHLLGYDHVAPAEAEEMEQIETAILSGLGYGDPYADQVAT